VPQGRAKLLISTAPKRPIVRARLLRLTGPPPDAQALKREIAELEERLIALRVKLSGLTSPQRNGPKPRSRVREPAE
jgi:hypothetical protein